MESKKIIVIIGAILLIIAIIVGVSMNLNAKQSDKRVFTIGMDDSFPPMGFRNEKNEIVGIDIDMAKAVCDKLGWELKVQPISWAAKDQELNSGNIDCLWNGFGYTKERAENMTLTDVYLKSGVMYVTKADSIIASQNDFKGKKLGVQTGSTQQKDLEKSDYGKGIGEIVQYSDYLTAFMDMEVGGVDGVYVSKIAGNYIINSKNKNYKTIEETESICTSQGMVVAFKKENTELRDIVEKALYELKEEGKLKEISEKWLGTDLIALERK